jgi:hypothetical protein
MQRGHLRRPQLSRIPHSYYFLGHGQMNAKVDTIEESQQDSPDQLSNKGLFFFRLPPVDDILQHHIGELQYA